MAHYSILFLTEMIYPRLEGLTNTLRVSIKSSDRPSLVESGGVFQIRVPLPLSAVKLNLNGLTGHDFMRDVGYWVVS